jgi:hypothetical protein
VVVVVVVDAGVLVGTTETVGLSAGFAARPPSSLTNDPGRAQTGPPI